MIWIILTITLAIGLIGFYLSRRLAETVTVSDNCIRIKGPGARHQEINAIELDHLVSVQFHYHAAVNFIGHFELRDCHDRTLMVDFEARGIELMLKALNEKLDDFDADRLNRELNQGDITGSLELWQKTQTSSQCENNDNRID